MEVLYYASCFVLVKVQAAFSPCPGAPACAVPSPEPPLLPAPRPGLPLGLCQPSQLGGSLCCRFLEHPIFFLCSISPNIHHLAHDLFHFHLSVSTNPPDT